MHSTPPHVNTYMVTSFSLPCLGPDIPHLGGWLILSQSRITVCVIADTVTVQNHCMYDGWYCHNPESLYGWWWLILESLGRQTTGHVCEGISPLGKMRWEGPEECGQSCSVGWAPGLNKKGKASWSQEFVSQCLVFLTVGAVWAAALMTSSPGWTVPWTQAIPSLNCLSQMLACIPRDVSSLIPSVTYFSCCCDRTPYKEQLKGWRLYLGSHLEVPWSAVRRNNGSRLHAAATWSCLLTSQQIRKPRMEFLCSAGPFRMGLPSSVSCPGNTLTDTPKDAPQGWPSCFFTQLCWRWEWTTLQHQNWPAQAEGWRGC